MLPLRRGVVSFSRRRLHLATSRGRDGTFGARGEPDNTRRLDSAFNLLKAEIVNRNASVDSRLAALEAEVKSLKADSAVREADLKADIESFKKYVDSELGLTGPF